MSERQEIFNSTIEDKLKLQSSVNERIQIRSFEEVKEMEQKKSEEALRMVQYELWRCQDDSDEARRLQSSGNSRRVRKGLDLQHPASSESCRSSMIAHDEERTLEPPRNRREWPEWEETSSREEDAWRLEPEGETEVPETRVVAVEIKGIYVDLNGEGHQQRGQVKNYVRRRR